MRNVFLYTTSLVKIFSIFMALYPLLCLYEGFGGVTIGDLFLLVFFLIFIFRNCYIKIDVRTGAIILFALYAIILLLFNLILTDAASQFGASALLIRVFKFTFYMFSALLFGGKFLDLNIFRKTFVCCSIVASLFLFLQYVFYYGLGSVLIGQIPGLPLHLEEYSSIDYGYIYQFQFRPCSFYLEPAMFAQTTIVALSLVLFDHSVSHKIRKIVYATILTISVVLCTSGQGILYLVVVYLIYIFKGMKSKVGALIFAIILLCIVIIAFNNSDVFYNAVDRLLNNENASDARLDSYKDCFELSGLDVLFGKGYGTTSNGVFMAGAAYIWYGCGLFGLFIIMFVFLSLFIKANNILSRVFCVLFFIMFFGTSLFYNYMAFWYFSLILADFCSVCPKSMKNNTGAFYTRKGFA